MTGVVLCGGNSTRMGSDKGLLKEEDETWAELAARKLAALGLPVVVSVNPRQAPMYEAIFGKEKLVVDEESISIDGPLLGILSVHRQLPEEDLVVLACDMKEVTTDLLLELCNKAKSGKQQAAVFSTAGKLQPLCGIYTSRGLSQIDRLWQEGKLPRFSMMAVLETLQAQVIPVLEEDLVLFKNYNSPDDVSSD